MKTLNKPEIVAVLLFFVAFLFWLYSGPFISLLLSQRDFGLEIHTEIYKAIFVAALSSCSIFIYGRFITTRSSARQQQYFNLFLAHPSPMAIVDLQTQKFIAVNSASVTCYGYTLEEFLTLGVADIRVKEEENLMNQDLQASGAILKKAGIRKHRKKNGDILLSEVSTCEMIFDDKKCLLLLSRDITEILAAKEEKRIAEEEKIKQQSFMSYVLENFPVDVAIFDKNHRYLLLNKTAVKNDETRKWMIGKDDFDYFASKGTDLSMAEKRREKFLKAVRGESTEWVDEHIVNGKVKYILRKFFPYWEEGALKYVYGYGMDITEIKKAQLQREEYIRQLENIAFTTSHKIRQPICNLQGLISLLQMEQADEGAIENIISCMQISVSKMDDFTRDLAISLHEFKQNLSATENRM